MNRRFFCLLGVACVVGLSGCSKPKEMPKPRTPEVFVAVPKQAKVADYEDFIGTTDAVDKVDVRARVSGYLVKVAFTDGEYVRKGKLLYQIDPRPFEAALHQVEGDFQRLEAQKKLLDIQVERYTKLAEKGAGSQQDLDQYLAQRSENAGALKSAQAQIDTAKLNLGFTSIKSPIDGKVSRTYFTEGNLINADTTLLTTVVSIDPIYAYFDVEETTWVDIRRLVRSGVIKTKSADIVPVRMRLSGDPVDQFSLNGMLDFSNNAVNPQTGTIQIRGRFNNPHHFPENPPLLMPGYSVRVRLDEGTPHAALLISERAIGTDQGNKYVFVVDKDDKVAYRPIELGMVFGGLQEVKKGLKADDRIVVNGLQRIRSGVTVKPTVVEMTPGSNVNTEKAVQELMKKHQEEKENKLKNEDRRLKNDKQSKTAK